jgi:hypothetical protein
MTLIMARRTMWRQLVIRALVLSVIALVPACTPSSTGGPNERQMATVARQMGSWEGTGNKTVGFVSETGCFRINWKTRAEKAPGAGTFRLTVRSAISGRPIRVVADQQGEGAGTVDFADDPRMYDLMVDSTDIEWAFTVEEVFDVRK